MPRFSPAARRALSEERRKQILAAAIKVFAAKGFERATIAEIAREAGLAEGSIYNYFKNKGDLLIGLPRQILRPRMEDLQRMAGSSSPEELLGAIARTILGAIRENASVFRIILSAIPSMNQKLRDQYMEQVLLYAASSLQAYFQGLIDEGVLRPDLDSAVLARAFIGMFFPTILIREVIQSKLLDPVDYEQIISMNVQVFMRGALADPSAGKTARLRQKIQID